MRNLFRGSLVLAVALVLLALPRAAAAHYTGFPHRHVYGPAVPGGSSFADSDGDGLYDADETGVYGTNPYVYDTDGDGTGDGARDGAGRPGFARRPGHRPDRSSGPTG